MAEALAEGAGKSARLLAAADAAPDDFLAAKAYIFACPENLGAMSGAMKEMFDQCYYPLLGQVEGRAYATVIAAGSDGQGAQMQLDRIVTGWRLKRVADPLICNLAAQTPEAILAPKKVPAATLLRCRELGQMFAEAIEIGIF
jgi:multimeric flavodoxin WrbA